MAVLIVCPPRSTAKRTRAAAPRARRRLIVLSDTEGK
jgi:hypothetical protein